MYLVDILVRQPFIDKIICQSQFSGFAMAKTTCKQISRGLRNLTCVLTNKSIFCETFDDEALEGVCSAGCGGYG